MFWQNKENIYIQQIDFLLQYLPKIENYSIDQYKFSSYTTALMANTKSAIKRIRKIATQTLVNKARKSKYRNAIKKGGSSIRDFRDTFGKSGNFQKEFKVYQRDNLNCLQNKCSGKIKKIFISNRSTFFCNTCQK